MTGLMTVNSLIKNLMEELLSGSFNNYAELIKKKSVAYSAISSKEYNSYAVQHLGEVLEEQIKALQVYADNLSRVKRIIAILDSQQIKSSEEYKNNKKLLIFVLESIQDLLKPRLIFKSLNLIRVIETQYVAYKAKDYDNYLKSYYIETEMLNTLFKKLSKFPEFTLNTEKLRAGLKKASAVSRKMSIMRTTLIVSIEVICMAGSIYLSSPSQGTKLTRVHLNDGSVKSLYSMVHSYLEKDFVDSSKIESEFERQTNVNLIGEYRPDLLITVLNSLSKNYDATFLSKMGVKKLAFVEGSIHTLKGFLIEDGLIAAGMAVFHDSTLVMGAGVLSEETPEYLRSRQNTFSRVGENQRVFEHELAHFIHKYILHRHPEFNEEWSKIKGGYVSEYAKTNIAEDVAETASMFMSRKGIIDFGSEDIRKMPTGAIINHESLMQKLELLRKYNFFSTKVLE